MIDVKEFVVPKGYKLVKIVDSKLAIQKEINRLEKMQMSKPTDKELIEEGKMNHPYYLDKQRIEELKSRILEG